MSLITEECFQSQRRFEEALAASRLPCPAHDYPDEPLHYAAHYEDGAEGYWLCLLCGRQWK